MIGKTAEVTTVVTTENTAQAVGSGSLPVFATPMMVTLMEQAACACLADSMEPGQTSVGISVHIEHTSASVTGAEITASATIAAVSKRSVEFRVSARDHTGEIGSGRHIRVIVDEKRFMEKVKARGEAPS